MESARSAMLFRSTVATSVAIASMAALMPTLRFGPRRQPTIGARNDVANTAVAMMASVVLDWPYKVCWNVDENVRTSAMRKRRPMTAKVTSPTIRRATIGLALRAPGLRESRRGLIDQVADLYDRAEPGPGSRVDAHHESSRQTDIGALGHEVVEDLVRRRCLGRGVHGWKEGSRGDRREDGGRRGLRRGKTWLEARGAPHRGEPVARDLDHAKDEACRVIGESGVAEDLESRDTEDLVGGDERVLEDGDLPRLDALGAAHADFANEAVPSPVVARGVAVRTIVDGLTAHLRRDWIRTDDRVPIRDLLAYAVEERH